MHPLDSDPRRSRSPRAAPTMIDRPAHGRVHHRGDPRAQLRQRAVSLVVPPGVGLRVRHRRRRPAEPRDLVASIQLDDRGEPSVRPTSRWMHRRSSRGRSTAMPYDQPLPDADQDLIARWIEIGAPGAQCNPALDGGKVCIGNKVRDAAELRLRRPLEDCGAMTPARSAPREPADEARRPRPRGRGRARRRRPRLPAVPAQPRPDLHRLPPLAGRRRPAQRERAATVAEGISQFGTAPEFFYGKIPTPELARRSAATSAARRLRARRPRRCSPRSRCRSSSTATRRCRQLLAPRQRRRRARRRSATRPRPACGRASTT